MKENFPFMVYRSAEEEVSVNAVIKDETIWLTQKAMAELFDVDKSTISRHLKNIFQEGELQEEEVVAKIATTSQQGAGKGSLLSATSSKGWPIPGQPFACDFRLQESSFFPAVPSANSRCLA